MLGARSPQARRSPGGGRQASVRQAIRRGHRAHDSRAMERPERAEEAPRAVQPDGPGRAAHAADHRRDVRGLREADGGAGSSARPDLDRDARQRARELVLPEISACARHRMDQLPVHASRLPRSRPRQGGQAPGSRPGRRARRAGGLHRQRFGERPDAAHQRAARLRGPTGIRRAPQAGNKVRMPKTKDYYEVLGVPRTATQKEISSAFRKLARKFHPDLNANDKQAEARFKELSEAHGVLSDAKKRKLYDEFGPDWAAAEAAGAQPGSSRGGGGFRPDAGSRVEYRPRPGLHARGQGRQGPPRHGARSAARGPAWRRSLSTHDQGWAGQVHDPGRDAERNEDPPEGPGAARPEGGGTAGRHVRGGARP